jgi:hypothetical protein
MAMHAVIVNVSISNPEEALENLRGNIVPRVSQAPGFVAGYWYGDAQTKGQATIVFDSEDNAKGFVEMLRSQEGTGAATIDSVDVHEVVANA